MKKVFFSILILSLVLIAAGIALGQPAAVLAKARLICMECVGLG